MQITNQTQTASAPTTAEKTANTIIGIKSTHASLAEAVAASGMDLSYNPAAARQSIKDIEYYMMKGNRVSRAFVTNSGDVLYIFAADINLLNKFEPFFSIMDDSPFYTASIRENEIEINRLPMSRDKKTRKIMSRLNEFEGVAFTTL